MTHSSHSHFQSKINAASLWLNWTHGEICVGHILSSLKTRWLDCVWKRAMGKVAWFCIPVYVCIHFKGAVWFAFLCLHIFRKHANFTYLFIWKTVLQPVIWHRCSVSVFVLVSVTPPTSTSSNGISSPGCKLVENPAFCHESQRTNWVRDLPDLQIHYISLWPEEY